ncbi:DMT family transporter [Celerinatantimonas sp. YJH-8]|uniref:DMT family transporter n=1 Tax=Celerinatantimonas sp. YJH-8 TaxID=3228714 RepID=UPI0038C39A5A
MMHSTRHIFLMAFGAGGLLTTMIAANSTLATWSSPWLASWFAHGSGAIVAWLLWVSLGERKSGLKKIIVSKPPIWSYLGGIPGAFTVLLASIAVNSPLELAGTLGLMLTGQILFGLLSDLGGWFGVMKCRFSLLDFGSIVLILCGSTLLIFYR